MPETRRTGRDQEIVEIPPTVLDCGHPYGPRRITIGMSAHPDGGRRRYWRCNECGTITWDQQRS